MSSILKQSITNTNKLLIKGITTRKVLETLAVIAFVGQMVLLGVLCNYLDNEVGIGSGYVAGFVMIPGVILVGAQLIYAIFVADEYDKLVKENDKES